MGASQGVDGIIRSLARDLERRGIVTVADLARTAIWRDMHGDATASDQLLDLLMTVRDGEVVRGAEQAA